MRALATLLLVACGSPRATPNPELTSGRTRPSSAEAVLAVHAVEVTADAGVVVDAAVVVAVDVPDAAVPDAGSAPVPQDENVTMENGVPVIAVDRPMYCARSGLCATTAKECAIGMKYRCPPYDAFACFDYTNITDGKERRMCMSTYRQCSDISDYMNQNGESRDVSDCSIFRVKKKR